VLWLKLVFEHWINGWICFRFLRSYLGAWYSGEWLKRVVLAWSPEVWLSDEISRSLYLILNRDKFWENRVRLFFVKTFFLIRQGILRLRGFLFRPFLQTPISKTKPRVSAFQRDMNQLVSYFKSRRVLRKQGKTCSQKINEEKSIPCFLKIRLDLKLNTSCEISCWKATPLGFVLILIS
jgi:hypothetical protein